MEGILLASARGGGGGEVEEGLGGVEAREIALLGLHVGVAVLVVGVAHLAPNHISGGVGGSASNKGVDRGGGRNQLRGHSVDLSLEGDPLRRSILGALIPIILDITVRRVVVLAVPVRQALVSLAVLPTGEHVSLVIRWVRVLIGQK